MCRSDKKYVKKEKRVRIIVLRENNPKKIKEELVAMLSVFLMVFGPVVILRLLGF